jgi:hypothetical protein
VKDQKRRFKLRCKPCDLGTDDRLAFDKALANVTADPFATFTEWSSEADEKAYGSL